MNAHESHIRLLLSIVLAFAMIGCARETTPDATPPAGSIVAEPAPTPAPVPVTEPDTLVRVAYPAPGDTVTSPLAVRGEARGMWFFEASFPVRLLDAAGRELAVTYATAGGEWMTTSFVPFTSTVTFTSPPAGTTGTLVLQKDNPSDDRSRDDERRIPVVFAGP